MAKHEGGITAEGTAHLVLFPLMLYYTLHEGNLHYCNCY